MLPDLWRMAHKSVRPARADARIEATPELSDVLAGVLHHGRADTAFHASASFHEGERTLARDLAKVGASRLSLFAHIGWELCLDGALLRREPSLSVEVSDAIRELESSPGESPAISAARAHHAARKRERLPDVFDARLRRITSELLRVEWITGYARSDVVTERLDGIRRFLGLPPLTTLERSTCANIFEATISRGEHDVVEVLRLPIP